MPLKPWRLLEATAVSSLSGIISSNRCELASTGIPLTQSSLCRPHPRSFMAKAFAGWSAWEEEPKVELFAQGLFVRSASSLQDLQEAGEITNRAATEHALAGLPSLAPQVLIDSADLDLLLARSDVRYDRHLRRILRSADKELARLIQKQLQAIRPQPWYRPLLGALGDRIEPFLKWRFIAAGAVGALLGLVALGWLPVDQLGSERNEATTRRPSAATSDGKRRSAPATSPEPSVAERLDTVSRDTFSGDTGSGDRPIFFPYSDLGRSYRGPRPGGLQGDRSRAAILYEPEVATPFFNALVIDTLEKTLWTAKPVSEALPRYRGAPCRQDCLRVSLLVAGGSTPLRIPVATGHRLEASSVRLDGENIPVYETRNGEAVLLSRDRRPGLVEYRSGPALESSSARPSLAHAASLGRASPPDELAEIAAAIRPLSIENRVQRAIDYVARHVAYDRSQSTAGSYARAVSEHSDFVDAALAVGAGDCDVQNGVLLALLRLSDVEARLALGYVGVRGTVAPGLHAWVEYRDVSGRWSIADASVSVDPEIAESAATGSSVAIDEPPLSAQSAGVLIPNRVAESIDLSSGMPRQLGAIAILVTILGSAALMWRRGSSGDVELGTNEDLAALLGGALRHPEAFAGLSAMSHGRFVPLLGRSAAISLHRARRLGSKNRLFRTSGGSTLARKAAAQRIPVIDASTPEGRVLSLALGAIDLDRWSTLLKHSVDTRLCEHINALLDSVNALWRLREAPGLSEPWVEIALEDLRLGQRLILLDMRHLEFAPVRRLLPEATRRCRLHCDRRAPVPSRHGRS